MIALASALAACGSSGPGPSAAAGRYLGYWEHHDWSKMRRLVLGPPPGFVAENVASLRTLHVTRASYVAAASARVSGQSAVVPVTENLRLAVYGRFIVHSRLRLRLVNGRWRVVWSPATINPSFGTSGRYGVSYLWPPRAPVLAANGAALSPGVPTSVVVGLEGTYVKNVSTLEADLEKEGASAAAASSAVARAEASPSSFVPVMTLGWTRFEEVRAVLNPVPGVFFQAHGGGGSTPPGLTGVVGSLAAATPAQVASFGPPYTTSTVIGASGIEQAFQRRLAGLPSATILAVGNGPARSLARYRGRPGSPVRTTIEPGVEQAATAALAAAPGYEAALVAIDATSGRILAVANTSQGSDLALEGAQPPGSTMKVITSTALIERGLTPQSAATCPPTIDVDGEVLHNAGSEGPVSTLLQAFTVSCNTAFIGLTMNNLNDTSLHHAASLYRIGTTLGVGIPVFGGSVPVNDGQTDLAGSAIGQARVVMNPFDLAMVAADIDTARVRTPWLTVGAPAEHEATSPLPRTLVEYLKQMMLSVVQSGTAAGTGLPPGTFAKTGTAEYGSGNPLPLDGWLMGFNGNVAFAMVDVNSPGDGGPVDGPIVAHFLDSLGSAR